MPLEIVADEVCIFPATSDKVLPVIRQLVIDQLVGWYGREVECVEVDRVGFAREVFDQLAQCCNVEVCGIGIRRCWPKQGLNLERLELEETRFRLGLALFNASRVVMVSTGRPSAML